MCTAVVASRNERLLGKNKAIKTAPVRAATAAIDRHTLKRAAQFVHTVWHMLAILHWQATQCLLMPLCVVCVA